jgi:hypothetical protein
MTYVGISGRGREGERMGGGRGSEQNETTKHCLERGERGVFRGRNNNRGELAPSALCISMELSQ